MIDEATRAARIEKIRKCLRLSKSCNVNEAAAAMRQAQAMLRELGLTESDVDERAATSDVVITKEAFGGCKYLSQLVILIRATFGVDAVYEQGSGISRKRANVRYIGPRARVQLAVYTHKVIDRVIRDEWKKVRDEYEQQIGARLAFRLAFIHIVADKIQHLAVEEDEQQSIDRYKLVKYSNGLVSTKQKNHKKLNEEAAMLGAVAGDRFEINKPMNEDRMEIGHDG